MMRYGMILGLMSLVVVSAQTLTLREFVTRATQYDYQFHAILIDQLRLTYQQDLTVTAPDLVMDILGNLSVATDSTKSDGAVALSQTVPDLGQTIGISQSEETTTLTFSQDIARNAFGRSIALDRAIASIKTDVMRYQIIEAYEDYMAELLTLYYTWLRQYENWQLAQSSYTENLKVLDSIQARQRKKIADQTDVNKLRLLNLSRRQQVIAFDVAYQQTVAQIRRITQLGDKRLVPDTTIERDTLPLFDREAKQRIRTQARSFQLLTLFMDQAQTVTDRLSRELMPSIEVAATVVQADDDTTGLVGVSLAFPWQNRQAKARVGDAKVAEKKAELTAAYTAQKLMVDIENSYVALQAQQELVDIAATRRQIASDILARESENYSFGRINLNDYIEAVNGFDNARLELVTREIEFQRLSIQWKRLTGQLVTNEVLKSAAEARPHQSEHD